MINTLNVASGLAPDVRCPRRLAQGQALHVAGRPRTVLSYHRGIVPAKVIRVIPICSTLSGIWHVCLGRRMWKPN